MIYRAKRSFLVLLLLALGLVTACARVQFEGVDERLSLMPEEIAVAGEDVIGRTVVWGGRIVEVANFETGSELLVLALPLSPGNVPSIDRESVGRFVVASPEFLEPLDYAPGRYVSLAGRIEGMTDDWRMEGGPSEFPRVQSRQIHLWPRDPATWKPRFSIGVGIGIHN